MPTNPTRPMTAATLGQLTIDAELFRGELGRWRRCEEADAELDRDKRTELRKRIVDSGLVWKVEGASREEIDLLYGMAREVARIALARRSADFRGKYGIALTCGDAPSDEPPTAPPPVE